ncbi:HET-domain-containing protein [Parathielavia appendiculata]|uniref:HET-domain-containing protein n=1 Tax=Parathielavia appendiculata TaxID=2587402 RepID=A0AAN6TQM7_9PEZI|nr:HET-domain-containing protein [Parathielavia appendiculata]
MTPPSGPSASGYLTDEEDSISIFLREAQRTILLCRYAQTSTPAETEYAALLSEAVERLLSAVQWLAKITTGSVNDAPWFHKAELFLSQLNARLDPDNSRTASPRAEALAVRWRLTSDEVTDFVRQSDNLHLTLPGLSYKGSRDEEYPLTRAAPPRSLVDKLDGARTPRYRLEGVSPRAPPTLLINKLHAIRNRHFPPPQLGPWVDLSRVRRWLEHCDSHHVAHCQLSTSSEQLFSDLPRRLIDVQRRCLVSAEPRQRYAALSYVWGVAPSSMALRRNIDLLQQDGALNSTTWARSVGGDDVTQQFPMTIRHAMELTQQLGERLLWVDALCIVQDDDEERQHQLNRMGSIYANAYVTIVAAGGTALSGLRGIEGATPPMTRTVTTPYYLGHGREDHVCQEIQRSHRRLQTSAWSQRGWTFQEQIFSRRLLILDHTSVTWECHCAVWLEGMEPVEGQCQDNRAVVAQGFSFSAQPNLGEYARHATEFNRRELTYPEDALDAFAGILAVLSGTSFARGFICGLPVLFFDAALLWYNKTPLTRRRPRRQPTVDATSASANVLRPSWTWAAWQGAVEFVDANIDLAGASPDAENKLVTRYSYPARWLYQYSLVSWNYRANSGEDWKPIPSLFAERRLSRCNEEATEPTSPTTRGNHAADAQEHRNEAQVAESGIAPTLDGSHLLLAYPSRAFFHVQQVFGQATVLLADASGGCVGSLTSCGKPDKEAYSLPHPPCEVVAVSVSSLNGEESYDVLWIEWEGRIAYRRGVGRIRKPAWEAKKAERIELILG